MPDHAGKQALDRIVTDVTGLVTTGANVFLSRLYPVEEAALPALLVYADNMEAIRDLDAMQGDGNRGVIFGLSATVEALVKEVTAGTAETTAWTILSEVQTALEGDNDLNSLAKDIKLESVEWERHGEGDKAVLSMKMDWTVIFRIKETAPTAVLN